MPSAFGDERLRYTRTKRKGFSLIVVLIVAIIGLAVVGTIVQLAVTSGGGGRISSASSAKYNFMQAAVEEGKAKLKEAMDIDEPALRYVGFYSAPPTPITTLDGLLISQDFPSSSRKGVVMDNKPISKAELGRLGIAGNGGTMSVMIYDLQYPTTAPEFAVPNPSPDFDRLPPSIPVWSGGTGGSGSGTLPPWMTGGGGGTGFDDSFGSCLIRAVLTIGGKETILDSAVIQATKKH